MATLKQESNQQAVSLNTQTSVKTGVSQQQALELAKATVSFLGTVASAFSSNNPNAQAALKSLSSDAANGIGPKNPASKLDLSSLSS